MNGKGYTLEALPSAVDSTKAVVETLWSGPAGRDWHQGVTNDRPTRYAISEPDLQRCVTQPASRPRRSFQAHRAATRKQTFDQVWW